MNDNIQEKTLPAASFQEETFKTLEETVDTVETKTQSKKQKKET
jgi:hypothetical protein